MKNISLDDVYADIMQKDWIEDEFTHVSIELTINYWSGRKLSSSNNIRFQKIVSVYSELSEILKEQEREVETESRKGSFQIRVITSQKEIKQLQKVTARWLERIQRIDELAKSKVLQVSKEKQLISEASLSQINTINAYLKNDHSREVKDGFKVYSALDTTTQEVEGIAIISPEGRYLKIFDRVTNSKNLVIFDIEQGVVRGTGTKLIEKLALDAMVLYKKSHLCLQTLPASRMFYEKLGFVERDDIDEEDQLELPFDIMERFANKSMATQGKTARGEST